MIKDWVFLDFFTGSGKEKRRGSLQPIVEQGKQDAVITENRDNHPGKEAGIRTQVES